jgi:MFS family permease
MAEVADVGKGYRRRLLRLLAAATFFEGYDSFVLALVLPLILVDLGGSETSAGVVRGIVGAGGVAGFILAAQADRIGRRRLLLITIAGYTAGTALTAASTGLAWLTVAQFVAQVFLGAEWAVAMTIVAEDFPRTERGRAFGIVASMNTLGGIFVGVLGVVLGLVAGGTPNWRVFYVVGLVPLVLIFWGRRGMRETERYAAVRADARSASLDHTSLWEPWRDAYRRNLLAVGLMHFFRFVVISSAVFWWPFYAVSEVGMSFATVSLYIGVAGIVGAVGFIVAGRLMDRYGRRPIFLLYEGASIVFGILAFQLREPLLLLPTLSIAIFFGLGSAAMTSAFSTEFFPTYVRSRAAAWCRNAFEIPGGILGPLLVGYLGDHTTGAIGSVGDAMSVVFVACMVPVLFIGWRYISETKGIELADLDEVAA